MASAIQTAETTSLFLIQNFCSFLQLYLKSKQVKDMNPPLDWHAVIQDLAPALYRYFYAGFNVQTAEDLVQNTLIRLIEKVQNHQFDSSQGSLRMYAFGIAHFVRLEARRQKKKDFSFELDDNVLSEENSPETNLEQQSSTKQLRQAIALLTEVQQNVLHLYLDEELTMDQIALILEMPVGTVKSHLHRAKEDLKKHLIEIDHKEVDHE